MIKNILNFLDYVLFLGMFYLMYLGLKHADQINQLIIGPIFNIVFNHIYSINVCVFNIIIKYILFFDLSNF